MKQEIKEAADELLADIRHTLAWAAREHGTQAMEEMKQVLEDGLEGLAGGQANGGRERLGSRP